MPNGSFGAQPTGADFGRVAGNTSFATPIGFQVLATMVVRCHYRSVTNAAGSPIEAAVSYPSLSGRGVPAISF